MPKGTAYSELSGGLQARVALVFLKQVHPLYCRISVNILRETALYLDLFALLPCLSGSTLSLICMETGRERKVNLSQSFSQFSQCCIHSAVEIIFFPNLHKEVWEYSLLSNALSPLPSISACRDWPAIVSYRAKVYVFGGYRLTTNERLEVERWELIGNSSFNHFQTNPCPVGDEIYLCDQRTSDRGTEAYSIASDSFRQINSPSRFELSGSVSLAVDDTLVWLTCLGEVITQQNEDAGRILPVHDTPFLPTLLCPIKYRNGFYWRQLDGQVRCWKSPAAFP